MSVLIPQIFSPFSSPHPLSRCEYGEIFTQGNLLNLYKKIIYAAWTKPCPSQAGCDGGSSLGWCGREHGGSFCSQFLVKTLKYSRKGRSLVLLITLTSIWQRANSKTVWPRVKSPLLPLSCHLQWGVYARRGCAAGWKHLGLHRPCHSSQVGWRFPNERYKLRRGKVTILVSAWIIKPRGNSENRPLSLIPSSGAEAERGSPKRALRLPQKELTSLETECREIQA